MKNNEPGRELFLSRARSCRPINHRGDPAGVRSTNYRRPRVKSFSRYTNVSRRAVRRTALGNSSASARTGDEISESLRRGTNLDRSPRENSIKSLRQQDYYYCSPSSRDTLVADLYYCRVTIRRASRKVGQRQPIRLPRRRLERARLIAGRDALAAANRYVYARACPRTGRPTNRQRHDDRNW